MTATNAGRVLSTILRHDAKVTSYKLALIRALNDVVLAFPDVLEDERAGAPVDGVAVPLRLLAERWIAYYWSFADPQRPVLQGRRSRRTSGLSHDVSFRPQLEAFRAAWEASVGGVARPADGFVAVDDLHIPRKRAAHAPEVRAASDGAVAAVVDALRMPIRHAGPGEWTVFARPERYDALPPVVAAVPGTRPADVCLVVRGDLWRTFHALSLWVEALCIHEWCLFTERIAQEAEGDGGRVDRGWVYRLLTDRPDNRRPLTWERNQVDLLLLEGRAFVCPWTERPLTRPGAYDLDHLVPLAVYPVNELWNLVPADAAFNTREKRDRLPSPERVARATPHLALAYRNYASSPALARALREDVAARFAGVRENGGYPDAVAAAAAGFLERIAGARNLARF